MNERVKDKINEIEKHLDELAEIKPDNIEEYIKDLKTKAACERYAEVIIEAIIDLAFLIIKDKKLPSPESDLHAFDILSQNKIIANELAVKLQDAKRMRNILAHEYGEVDDEIVFHAIKEEIERDAREFIESVKEKPKAVKVIKKDTKLKGIK